MLSQKIVAITSLLIYTTISNATPGDAAYKAGQFEAAAKLYKLGSEQGDAEAALKLGLLLEKTKLTDYVQSGEWYIKACNLGNNVGCHNAGYASENGLHGLTKNHLVAESYYRKAAQRGYMQSQYNLGSMYANQYLNGDLEGLQWLLVSQNIAQKCKDRPLCKWILEDPPKHIPRIQQRLTPQEVVKATEFANSWKIQE